ncbi:MAG: molybdopterin converting factor subunit 1 [Spirochaetes bacterium]|nr:molybdopterin converting factor subunit 1 [Spirochaetota bacterium]
MIQIRVKMFASLAEACGFREQHIDVPMGCTPSNLFDTLQAQHPNLAQYSNFVLVAVNASHAQWDMELKEGDEVAFFPPVSGG